MPLFYQFVIINATVDRSTIALINFVHSRWTYTYITYIFRVKKNILFYPPVLLFVSAVVWEIICNSIVLGPSKLSATNLISAFIVNGCHGHWPEMCLSLRDSVRFHAKTSKTDHGFKNFNFNTNAIWKFRAVVIPH